MKEVKKGIQTSEYEVQQKAGFISILIMALGIVVMSGSAMVAAIGDVNSTAGVFAGLGLTILAAIYDAMIKLGYIKSRAMIKSAAYYEDTKHDEGD